MSGKLTKPMSDWLACYRDGVQNGKPYPVNSVWTRGKGTSFPGIAACRAAGLIVSEPDQRLRPTGWRHDITPAGRALLTDTQQGAET